MVVIVTFVFVNKDDKISEPNYSKKTLDDRDRMI